MWIAETTAGDGIAIVACATVIFLILFGIVALVKWISRLISGKPDPAKKETVVLVLEHELQDGADTPEDIESIRKFALYLHSKLAEETVGGLSNDYHENNELFLCFSGSDANRIWELLDNEVRDYSPKKPQRVTLNRAKKKGGKTTLHQIVWQPGRKLDFLLPNIQIPEKWTRFLSLGRVLAIAGFSGLAGWNAIRILRGQTENEFVETGLGIFLAYVVGTLIVSGLSLGLVCRIRIRAIVKAAGFPSENSSTSITLKYVLMIVIAIFGLILILT